MLIYALALSNHFFSVLPTHLKGAGEKPERSVKCTFLLLEEFKMCSEVRCWVSLQQQNNWSCTEHILQISLFGDINLGCNSITAEVQGSLSMDLRGTRFSTLYRSIQVVINKHMAGKKSCEGHVLCRIWKALFFPSGKPLALKSCTALC